MTTLDFPVAPLVGDRHPTPPVAGMPQYIWDGEKWTTAANTITTAPPSTGMPLEDNATPQIGVTTKYAREDHVHPSTALKYSAQTLTSAQAAQSRKNIYGAPLDALAYSGLQINGSMEVSQERGTASVTLVSGAAKYIVDGFTQYYVHGANTAVFNAMQNTNIGATGFQSALYIAATTALPSMAAGDIFIVSHPVEGYRWSRLAFGNAAASSVTIGFWVFATVAGTMAVNLHNNMRSYAVNVPVGAATWQYKTVTIPGCTDGTWVKDNTVGASLSFCFGAGTNFQGANATWAASSNVYATSATTNFFAVNGNVIYLTGVVVLPGIEAPSAERSPLIMRPYDQELPMCQRYYEKQTKLYYSAAYANSSTAIRAVVPYAAKRAAPTITLGGSFYFNAASANFALTSPVSIGAEATGQFHFQATTTGLTLGHAGALVDFNASSIAIDARL